MVKAAAPAAEQPSMPSRAPRVCLLHNYREHRQMSMKLYAEKLGEALEARGLSVERVRPAPFLPGPLRRGRLLEKVDLYGGRFVTYPRIVKGLRADLFHVVDHGQAYLLAHLDPARTVVTCHDIILLVLASGRLRSSLKPILATRVLRHSLERMKRTRWIIADSVQTKRDLADLAGVDPATVRVIHPGLNHPFEPSAALRAEARRRWNLGGGPLVLHVGHADFYKNLEGCLHVVQRLRKDGLDVTFVRAGTRMWPRQRALAERLGLGRAIRDLGPASSADLAALYNGADVLLFPSFYEGFGWPPLEAMASGLPVVCSRAGSLPEVVADAALEAEPEDVDGLAAQVAAVLASPALAEDLRRRGLERARYFTWERTADEVLEVYRSALGVCGPGDTAAGSRSA